MLVMKYRTLFVRKASGKQETLIKGFNMLSIIKLKRTEESSLYLFFTSCLLHLPRLISTVDVLQSCHLGLVSTVSIKNLTAVTSIRKEFNRI